MGKPSPTTLTDCDPGVEVFRADVIRGLSLRPKLLRSKYFYDERGSRLFDEICDLDEYYLTRAELEITQRSAVEFAEQIGEGVRLVEFGSGSSLKTRTLLDHLVDPVAYVPVDISRSHLQKTADDLSLMYPHIEILPVCADFTTEFELPDPDETPSHTAVYFPGSTIGNLQRHDAEALLARIARMCGRGGGLLIGIDLEKDVSVLKAAYNDEQGVTAEFNLNLLRRINRELDADFCLQQFEHTAFYNRQAGRMEMHLRSLEDQTVVIDGESFEFEADETICTEYSHKYTIPGFTKIAAAAGLTVRRTWTDSRGYFAVVHCVVQDSQRN